MREIYKCNERFSENKISQVNRSIAQNPDEDGVVCRTVQVSGVILVSLDSPGPFPLKVFLTRNIVPAVIYSCYSEFNQ